jgi:hypothetical protein
VSKDAASLKNAAASVSRGEASLKNADEWASSNAGELVSKNAVAGSRPPPAAADSKAGPARGKDNPAPTWAEAAPPVGALAEAADRPAAGPASADTADTGRQAGAGGPPAALPAITTDEREAFALRAPFNCCAVWFPRTITQLHDSAFNFWRYAHHQSSVGDINFCTVTATP